MITELQIVRKLETALIAIGLMLCVGCGQNHLTNPEFESGTSLEKLALECQRFHTVWRCNAAGLFKRPLVAFSGSTMFLSVRCWTFSNQYARDARVSHSS